MIEFISEPSKHTFTKPSFESVYIIFESTIYKNKGQK